jgi:hypothetical protein
MGELLGFHTDSVANFKEQLDDYTKMRDETLRMKGELEALRREPRPGRIEIEKKSPPFWGRYQWALNRWL